MCMEEYASTAKDTLMINVSLVKNDSLSTNHTYLMNARYDNVAENIYEDCTNPDCNETIVKVISIDKNGQSIYICPRCNNKFI